MNNYDIKTAKALLTAGSIVAIVVGALWCFSIIGILWGVPLIIGGIILLGYRKLSDELFITKRNVMLGWGIFFIFTTLVGGILVIIAYITSNVDTNKQIIEEIKETNETEISNYDTIEKAFELKEKGIISEEEFQAIKKKHL